MRQTIAADLLKVRTGGAVGRTSESISPEVLNYLVKWSTGGWWYVFAAKTTLARTTGIEAIAKSLLAALDDRRPEVCIAALQSLRLVPPNLRGDTVSKSLALLESRDESIRFAAAQTLVEVAKNGLEENSILRLANALREEDSVEVGEEIIGALVTRGNRVIEDPRAQASLNSMFSDQRVEVRALAAQAFQLIAGQPTTDQVDAFFRLVFDSDSHIQFRSRDVLRKILGQDPADALVQRILELCSREDSHQRSFSAEALGWLNPAVAARHVVVDKLSSLCRDEKLAVRMSAGGSLTGLARKGLQADVLDVAARLLNDPISGVQTVGIEVIQGLGRIAMRDHVVERLLALLSAGNGEVRSAAAWALGQADESRMADVVVEKLMAVSRSGETNVRVNAIRALGVLGEKTINEELINTVVSALKDRRVLVRAAAAIAIKQMGQKVAREETVEELLAALTRKPIWERITIRPIELIFMSLRWVGVPPLEYLDLDATLSFRPTGIDEVQAYRRYIWMAGGPYRFGMKQSVQLRAAAASAPAVLGSVIATKRVLDCFRTLLDSRATPTDEFVQAKVLAAMAELGSRTMSEFVFDEIVRILRKQPSLAEMMTHRYEYGVSVLPLYYYVVDPHFAEVCQRDISRHPLVVVGRKMPASVVAERLAELLKGTSLPLRLLALGVLGALVSGEMPGSSVEAISRNLQDEEPHVRERAWELLERHNKGIAVWN